MKEDQEKNIRETIKKDQENDELDEDMIYDRTLWVIWLMYLTILSGNRLIVVSVVKYLKKIDF